MQTSVKKLIQKYGDDKARSQLIHARLTDELFKEASRIREKDGVTWTTIVEAGVRAYVLENGGKIDRE